MTDTSLQSLFHGLHNLLFNCVKVQPGDHLLLIGEDSDNCFFEPELCSIVAEAANKLDLTSEIILAAPVADAADFPEHVKHAMSRADKTIFFSRLGDQIRFNLEDSKSKNFIAYITKPDYFASAFAQVDYNVMMNIHNMLEERLLKSESYQLLGDCGTFLTGELTPDRGDNTADFALEFFPVMIFPPVNCHKMDGYLVIQRFVTSSSTRAYENSTLILDDPITATVKSGQMVAFDGSPDEIKALTSHLERAASLTGGNPYLINSWHTGINPGTYFMGNPYEDLEKWGTIAFGSPRYTHMHAAGKDPGDVAFHLMDLSVFINGEMIWDKGRFVFLDYPEVQALIPDDQKHLLNSSVLNEIGF